MNAISDSEIQVDFAPPSSDGGSHVTSYKVEWDTDPGNQEIQTITTSTFTGPNEIISISTSAADVDEVQEIRTTADHVREEQLITTSCDPYNTLSGTFTIKLDTTATGGSVQTSGVIGYDSAAEDGSDRSSLQSILEAMTNVDQTDSDRVNVTRSDADSEFGYTWTITFPYSMGDVPQVTLGSNSLGGTGANVAFRTVTEGNIIRGSFRVTYSGATTIDLPYNSLDVDVKEALEALAPVETVDVVRTGPDHQRGYVWTVTFTSDVNSGDLDIMTTEYADTLTGTGSRALIHDHASLDAITNVAGGIQQGNELGGQFQISFDGNTQLVSYAASAAEMKAKLELVGTQNVAVTRSGPDPELGYTWVVTFLQTEGDVADLSVDPASLTASAMSNPAFTTNCPTSACKDVTFKELRKGTQKEVQLLSTSSTGTVSSATYFRLKYDGQTTNEIAANPASGDCASSVRETQRVTITSTNIVSSLTTFRLVFEDKGVTGPIAANPQSGDCVIVAAAIGNELQMLTGVGAVIATGVPTGDLAKHQCQIDIEFTALSGDRHEMTVMAGDSAAGSSAQTGGDTVAVTTETEGTVDSIKTELEMLTNVGTVTVSPVHSSDAEECTWQVTFDTNAGDLPVMEIAAGTQDAVGVPSASLSVSGADTVEVAKNVSGTSEALGGHYTVEFRGQRTGYLPRDVTAAHLQSALQGLSTIGSVDVYRDQIDMNGGYTWTVSFKTELGNLDPLIVDDRALTGTVATGTVQEVERGVPPPFNSKDPEYGLSLGSAVITELNELSLVVGGLAQGIPYFFRVSATNAVGYGLPRISSPPYEKPLAQPPSAPSSVSIAILDGSSLRVTTEPPLLDGGKAVDKFKIEYANSKMQDEVQSVRLSYNVTPEVQVIATTSNDVAEEQIIQTTSTFETAEVAEEQNIVCDASGGSFTISFNGKTTAPIAANEASAAAIKDSLEELTSIHTVDVTFFGGWDRACQQCDATGCSGGFTVKFVSVTGALGDMRSMTTDVSQLDGNRRADVFELVKGQSKIAGTFRLSFRGYITTDLDYNISAASLEDELNALGSLGPNQVEVQKTLYDEDGGRQCIWKVSFAGDRVGGDVEAIEVDPLNMKLMGNGATVAVHTDAGSGLGSVRGNELGGYFTLTLRGHTTAAITHMASDTTMKQRLEELPNIGTVDVHRTGPTPNGGYTWSVTFLSNPGAFPVGSSNIAAITPNYLETLTGTNKAVVVTDVAGTASEPLEGTYTLSYGGETTMNMRNDISAAGLKESLETLPTIGRVDVERTVNADGFTWLVTFNGCRTVNNQDVCNIGNIDSMQPDADMLTPAGKPGVTVYEVTPGSGPAGHETITDLSGGAPYIVDINGLKLGEPYYVRVYAHTAVSYGARALSTPESATPAHQPPGPPPAVILKESTGPDSDQGPSITLRWLPPSRNGGQAVAGYELWMDEWAGGRSRMVFDGTGQPDKTEDTIYARDDGIGVEAGRQYRFQVRAINYCHPSQPNLVCHGEFSPVEIFTVRAPRVPLPPAAPTRDSLTNLGSTTDPDDGAITVSWKRPLDNGGAAITSYELYIDGGAGSDYRHPTWDGLVANKTAEGVVAWEGSGVFTSTTVPSTSATCTVDREECSFTFNALRESHIYQFYVIALNANGASGQSPVLSVLLSAIPTAPAKPVLTDIYTTTAAVSRNLLSSGGLSGDAPEISDQLVTHMTLEWSEPSGNIGSPITGYKLYQFKGIGKVTVADLDPVKLEQQEITTYVDTPVYEQQVVTIDAGAGKFRLRLGEYTTEPLAYDATDSAVKSALEQFATVSEVTVTQQTISGLGSYTKREFTITFNDAPEPIEKLVVLTDQLETLRSYSVERSRPGSKPLDGLFTVAFRGYETPRLSFNVDDAGMKQALENLPSVGYVDVVKTASAYGTASWVVTFRTEMGDLPAMVVTSGLLTGGNARVGVRASYGPGSAATLVYDGSQKPEVKQFTVTGLEPDALYAFKVVAINAVGDGIASAATSTIAARAGSSASHTTVSGSALTQGIAGVVYEQQTIECASAVCQFSFSLVLPTESFGPSAQFDDSTTAADMKTELENIMKIGSVQVTRTERASAFTWTVTFMELVGDIPLLSSDDGITISEFVQGEANHFTIEPKKASGNVVKDLSSADSFVGQDTFFTELWTSSPDVLDGTHAWELDGGIATYNPVIYEIQTFTLDTTTSTSGTFGFRMDTSLPSDDYDLHGTPRSHLTQRKCCLGGSDQTTAVADSLNVADLNAASDAEAAKMVKDIIETLSNVQHVDVSRSRVGSEDTYSVTFSQDLGDRPALQTARVLSVADLTEGAPLTTEQNGLTEVQTITTSADRHFVREMQSITTYVSAGNIGGDFRITLDGADGYVTISATATADEMEDELEKLSNVRDVDVAKQNVNGDGTATWTVKFIDPVGDVKELTIDSSEVTSDDAAATKRVDVQEVVKGESPLGGTFVMSYGIATTANLKFDISAEDMKYALETLSTIDEVDVTRNDLGTGHRWTVSFTKNLGNLPPLVARPFRHEEVTIQSLGGNPTPLGGTFSLSFGGSTVEDLPYDISQQGMKAALQSMPSIGTVDVNRDTRNFGQYDWRITFRSNLGNLPTISATSNVMTGSSAQVTVTEIISGDDASLTGSTPRVEVREKTPGLPSYTGYYTPEATGSYTLAIRQLERGGLHGDYYDNQWLLQTPVISRIDPTISFAWGTGLITQFGRDYVSARWSGKIKAPTTETYTLYLLADDGARLWIDHNKVIDTWDVTGVEQMTTISFTKDHFHDIRVEFKEERGPANIQLRWSSFSQPKQTIPADRLYHATHVAGSPFAINVVPGAADYPHSTASGPGLTLTSPVAGEPALFTIQAADQMGNNKTVGGDTFTVQLHGPVDFDLAPYLTPEYIGGGKYAVSYTALKTGNYTVSIKAGGTAEFHSDNSGTHIYCGSGSTAKCSPFPITVRPGRTVRQTTTASDIANEPLDALVEAAAGDVARFSIQAKDTFGNNHLIGDDTDEFKVLLTHQSNEKIRYRGNILDNGDSTYEVDYTVLTAGNYTVDVLYQGLRVLTCPRGPGCLDLNEAPSLLVVHGDLHPPSSIASDTKDSDAPPHHGLSKAVTGLVSSFTVHSRDQFENPRRGDGTLRFPGYGDGESDAFLVTLNGPDGYKVVTSTAVESVTLASGATGWFTLAVGGKTTTAMPHDITESGMRTVLEETHGWERTVEVHRTTPGDTVWSITFTSHLAEWSADQLTVDSTSTGLDGQLTVASEANAGDYPASYTLYRTGLYSMSVTSGGMHIMGSPFTVTVDDGVVHPVTSTSTGPGLVGGVAGTAYKFTVQAKDVRAYEEQAIKPNATVVDAVFAEQTVTLTSAAAGQSLTFRGSSGSASVASGDDFTAVKAALEAIYTVGTGGVEIVEEVGTVQVGTAFTVRFIGAMVSGAVPLLDATASLTVAHSVAGVAAFRKEVQAIQCGGTSGSFTLSFREVPTSDLDAATTTVDDLESALAGLSTITTNGATNGVTVVSEAAPSVGTTLVCTGANIFITYDLDTGDLPDTVIDDSLLTGGAVQKMPSSSTDGIHPVWGNFKLSYGGESTGSLPFYSSASEVKTALESLSTVGEVTVYKDLVGADTVRSGEQTLMFPIWTVRFDLTTHPNNIGDLPLIEADADNLLFEASGQFAPTLYVLETMPGSSGNNRQDGEDLAQVSFALQSTFVDVGVKEVQEILCDASSGSTIDLYYKGAVLNDLDVMTTLAEFENKLNNLMSSLPLGSVTVTNVGAGHQSTLCERGHGFPEPIRVTFDQYDEKAAGVVTNFGDMPMLQANQSGDARVSISEIVKGVAPSNFTSYITTTNGTVAYEGGTTGRYNLEYVPTVKGLYAVQVYIDSVHIETDLSSGVTVVTAPTSAPHSTHTALPIAMEDVMEKFTIQAKDEFLNDLDGSIAATDSFFVQLVGETDPRSGLGPPDLVVGTITEASPNTDGTYAVEYFPKVAGNYVLSVTHRRPGGLLVTYFHSDDLSEPVLTSRAHCPVASKRASGAAMDPCDSSAIDANVYSSWGTKSPLDFLTSPAPVLDHEINFPQDRFSVRWEGQIVAPTTETYSLHAGLDADGGVRVLIDGVAVIDHFNKTTAEELSGEVSFVAGQFYNIVVEYREGVGESFIHLMWSSATTPKEQIPSAALFYTRHLDRSPMAVTFYPGTVDTATSNAVGAGLTSGVALRTSSFTIQAKDTHGNNRYHSGINDWVIRLTGTAGWAAEGRTNDYHSLPRAPHVYDPSNICEDCAVSLAANVITVDVDVIHQLIPGTAFSTSVGGAFYDNHERYRDWRSAPRKDCVFETVSTTKWGAGSATVTVKAGHGCVFDSSETYSIRTMVKLDWIRLGTATVTHGSMVISPDDDFTQLPANSHSAGVLTRGDVIVVGTERFTVHDTLEFSALKLTLSSEYLGPSANGIVCYKAGTNAGTHLVNFVPQVEGTYRLDVKEPAVHEVQRVTTGVAPGATLDQNGSTFDLTFGGFDSSRTPRNDTARRISFDADDADMTAALESLENIPVGSVTVRRKPVEMLVKLAPG